MRSPCWRSCWGCSHQRPQLTQPLLRSVRLQRQGSGTQAEGCGGGGRGELQGGGPAQGGSRGCPAIQGQPKLQVHPVVRRHSHQLRDALLREVHLHAAQVAAPVSWLVAVKDNEGGRVKGGQCRQGLWQGAAGGPGGSGVGCGGSCREGRGAAQGRWGWQGVHIHIRLGVHRGAQGEGHAVGPGRGRAGGGQGGTHGEGQPCRGGNVHQQLVIAAVHPHPEGGSCSARASAASQHCQSASGQVQGLLKVAAPQGKGGGGEGHCQQGQLEQLLVRGLSSCMAQVQGQPTSRHIGPGGHCEGAIAQGHAVAVDWKDSGAPRLTRVDGRRGGRVPGHWVRHRARGSCYQGVKKQGRL